MGEDDIRRRESTSRDLEDIRQTLAGDGTAYARLVERHQEKVAARMWRFTRNTSVHKELVQDVFVETFTSLRTYKAKAPFEHWLAKISTAVGYRYWRKKSRERVNPTIPIEDWDQVLAVEPDSLDPEKAAGILHTLMEQLPPRDRLVLMLRYIEDRSVEETAELTGWTQTMVKVQAWRARSKLKRLFETSGLEV
ncbi:RNA polymerase sigma factor, sigma-70 family [Desulfomonile tiedjei DSM 6799]|uniref:RNA polymerase sigma factor, sigma-70 family n=1 Tax=Desulfomonile tiedjei (strain ATCC 49306 / DSM 6799 / DCB-1) TaxID=706587 RepID=I4C614_DESTA|nr:RNA polymerase sigma factor, sigma-70 family [Desulfomonile tiedjei DSM 6799]